MVARSRKTEENACIINKIASAIASNPPKLPGLIRIS